MSEDEKDSLTCDDVFCLYLGDICKQVNPTYYKVVLKFIMLYRDCLNELGWQKRREHFIKTDIPQNEDEIYMKIKEQEFADPEGTKLKQAARRLKKKKDYDQNKNNMNQIKKICLETQSSFHQVVTDAEIDEALSVFSFQRTQF